MMIKIARRTRQAIFVGGTGLEPATTSRIVLVVLTIKSPSGHDLCKMPHVLDT